MVSYHYKNMEPLKRENDISFLMFKLKFQFMQQIRYFPLNEKVMEAPFLVHHFFLIQTEVYPYFLYFSFMKKEKKRFPSLGCP